MCIRSLDRPDHQEMTISLGVPRKCWASMFGWGAPRWWPVLLHPEAAVCSASEVATSRFPFQPHRANIPWKKLRVETDFCVSQSRVESFQCKIFRFRNKIFFFLPIFLYKHACLLTTMYDGITFINLADRRHSMDVHVTVTRLCPQQHKCPRKGSWNIKKLFDNMSSWSQRVFAPTFTQHQTNDNKLQAAFSI